MLKNDLVRVLESIPINVNCPGLTLASLIDNPTPCLIPLNDSSLNSEFCKGVKWHELVGDTSRITSTYEIDGIKLLPIHIKPRVVRNNTIRISTTYVLDKSVKHIVLIPYDTSRTRPYRYQGKISKTSHPKIKRFYFNGIEFNISDLTYKLPKMNKSQLQELGRNIIRSITLVLEVDYIISDTNNWCSFDQEDGTLRYKTTLEIMAHYIEKHKLSTKFLVMSEILMELKRLSNKFSAARQAQRLLSDNFTPRNLVFIPNPYDELSYNVIADPCIQKQVIKLYREGKRLSVISNDQQAMMLFQAAVSNEKHFGGFQPPIFLSLENINQLRILLEKISKQLKRHE